jgi:hypothetical protein
LVGVFFISFLISTLLTYICTYFFLFFVLHTQLYSSIKSPHTDEDFHVIQCEDQISLERFNDSELPPQLVGLTKDMLFKMSGTIDRGMNNVKTSTPSQKDSNCNNSSHSSSRGKNVSDGGNNDGGGGGGSKKSSTDSSAPKKPKKSLNEFHHFLEELNMQSMELWNEAKGDIAYSKAKVRNLQDVQEFTKDFNLHLLLRYYWSGRMFCSRPAVGKTKEILCCTYCKNKIRLKFVDTLTYPRPVRQFGLLLSKNITLFDLRKLLLKEIVKLYFNEESSPGIQHEVVFLTKGKKLDRSMNKLELSELGFVNNQTIVITVELKGKKQQQQQQQQQQQKQKHVGDPAFEEAASGGGSGGISGAVTDKTCADNEKDKQDEAKKRIEKNQRFVSDLLFGRKPTTESNLTDIRSNIMGHIPKNCAITLAATTTTSQQQQHSSQIAADSPDSSSSSSFGAYSSFHSIAYIAGVDHGLRILRSTLTMTVKRNIYAAWKADRTSRDNAEKLIELFAADEV